MTEFPSTAITRAENSRGLRDYQRRNCSTCDHSGVVMCEDCNGERGHFDCKTCTGNACYLCPECGD